MHNDPFRRSQRSGNPLRNYGSSSTQSYQGQEGLELLFKQAMPYVLVRTDSRINCVCASQGNTGEKLCTRCFGTGKVIKSLDKFAAYVSKSSPGAAAPSTPQGWEYNDTKTIYTGRWVMASQGDLVLEVGWDCANDQVYHRGRVRTVDNVYLVKQPNPIGFQQVSYIELATVFANTRKNAIEDILLFSPILPPWKNCLAP